MPHPVPPEVPSLHLARILHGGGEVNGEGEVSSLELVRPPLHEGEPPEVTPINLAEPARWKASVNNVSHDEFWLSGRVSGTAVMDCSRCLEPTPVPVSARLEYLLRHDPKVETPRLEYGEDEQEVIVFGGPTLDLSRFLAESFALEMPLIVLHAPDCRGLCAACGANLNGVTPNQCAVGRSDCPHVDHGRAEDAANPFAKLKGLIED